MKSNSSFEKAVAIIENNSDDCDFVGPISSEMVAKAEKILALEFPPSYREFLLRFGAGDCWAEEFYGIIQNPETDKHAIPNAIWATLNAREVGNLPDHVIEIMSSGFGPIFVIDTSSINDHGENPILLYHFNGKSEVISPSFGDFFYQRIIISME